MLKYSPRFMPANTDGETVLFNDSRSAYRILAISTTGCFAIRNAEGHVRIFNWYFRIKGKEPVTIDPYRFIAIWACRAPWNEEQAGYLTRLHCAGCKLTALDVRSLSGLAHLRCEHNLLDRLDCSGMTRLETLDLRDNNLTLLDVDGCACLRSIRMNDNPNLRFTRGQLLRQSKGEGSLVHQVELTSTNLFDL